MCPTPMNCVSYPLPASENATHPTSVSEYNMQINDPSCRNAAALWLRTIPPSPYRPMIPNRAPLSGSTPSALQWGLPVHRSGSALISGLGYRWQSPTGNDHPYWTISASCVLQCDHCTQARRLTAEWCCSQHRPKGQDRQWVLEAWVDYLLFKGAAC